MKTPPPFHITRLEVDSFKRIVATAISPATGRPVLLTGDNGQGKSSVLDSILWALTRTGVGKPIMEGQPAAVVGVQISDGITEYVIKRRQKGDSHTLEVVADGDKIAKPQAFLDSLVGNLSFDPEAFARLKSKEQADQLRQATGLDTTAIDEEIKKIFTLRTEANRTEKAAEAAYSALPKVGGPAREVASAGDVVAELQRLKDEVATANAAIELRDDYAAEVSRLDTEIQSLEERLAALKEKRDKAEESHVAQAKNAKARFESIIGHAERIAELEAKIRNLDAENAEAQRHNDALRQLEERRAAWKTATDRAKELDQKLEDLRQQKADAIAAADMPVPGLSIEDDVVLLDGIPLSDLNTAKRIEVATRIAIAQNPKLAVIFVREGALINDSNLQLIAQVAEEANMQLWVEKFQPDPSPESLHIIDGMVAVDHGKPAAPVQTELL